MRKIRIIQKVFVIMMLSIFLGACSKLVEESSEPERSSDNNVEIIDEDNTNILNSIEEDMTFPVSIETEEEQEELYEMLEVHFIDVGEADSTLLICGDEAMLVDTGNPDQGSKIRLYMKKLGVNKLKYLLLTHSDRDHIGGAASVISNVDIENLFMCRYEKSNEVYQNLMNEINYKSMSWSTPEVGSVYSLGDAEFTIIAPNRDYDNPNDSSIAFIVRHGDDSFIFTGDAEKDAEKDILDNGLELSAKVYYVGHHGSNTSSSEEFLDKMNPEFAVISCAKDNEYGHPHVEVMQRLQERNVELFRTDEQGTIIAYSTGKDIQFNVQPSENWSSGGEGKAKSASELVKESLATANETEVNDGTATYVCNTNSMIFHVVTCESVRDMAEKNKEEVSLSREKILEMGFEPCQRCNP